MPVPKRSPSTERTAIAALRALVALWLGLLFVHVLEPVLDDIPPARVLVEAELRVGGHVPAPVADVASAHASLHALNARIRSGADQQFTSPIWRATQLPLRVRALAQRAHVEPPSAPMRRVVAWSWPLPRSSCHADGDPSALVRA